MKFDGWKMIDIPQLTRWNIGQSEELRWVYHHNWGSVEKFIPNSWVGMVGHVAHCCPLIMGVSGFLFSPKSVWGDPFRKKKWRASASILCGIHKQRKTRCYNIWRHKYKIIQVSIDTIDAFCWSYEMSLVTCQLSLSKLFVNAATAEELGVASSCGHGNNPQKLNLYIEKIHPFIQLLYYHLF